MFGPRFEAAVVYASSLHFGQRRKGAGGPYITHPLSVAAIVGEFGGDEDQAIAALLHDVMEDCGVSQADIAARYGERVAAIVTACTDTTERPKPPWRARKEAHIAKVRAEPGEVKLVIAADKLHNAESIARDLRRRSVGASVWGRFSVPRDQVLWYYRSMAEALAAGWEHEIADELAAAVTRLD
jgi:(p)ppGpp synthase/HD superfamily hydrolase